MDDGAQFFPTTSDTLHKMKALVDRLYTWEPEIMLALEHGGNSHSFDDVVQMIVSNRLHFFAFDRAFAIMEVVTYPKAKSYHCFLAGGEMSDVLAMEPILTKVALDLDCKSLSIAGRKGWTKVLAERGWSHLVSTMTKEIAQ